MRGPFLFTLFFAKLTSVLNQKHGIWSSCVFERRKIAEAGSKQVILVYGSRCLDSDEGAVEQRSARLPVTEKVAGSNPVSPATHRLITAKQEKRAIKWRVFSLA